MNFAPELADFVEQCVQFDVQLVETFRGWLEGATTSRRAGPLWAEAMFWHTWTEVVGLVRGRARWRIGWTRWRVGWTLCRSSGNGQGHD